MAKSSYLQPLQLPCMASNRNWTWMGSAPPPLSSPWDIISSSQAMPNLGGAFDWDISSSTNALDKIGTGLEIRAQNPDLDQFIGVTATSLSPTHWTSSGDSSTSPPGQASCEENAGSDEISRRALPTQAFADPQNTRKGIRKSRKYVPTHSLDTFYDNQASI